MAPEGKVESSEIMRAAKANFIENLKNLLGFVPGIRPEEREEIMQAVSAEDYMPDDVQVGDIDRFVDLTVNHGAPFSMEVDELKARLGI